MTDRTETCVVVVALLAAIMTLGFFVKECTEAENANYHKTFQTCLANHPPSDCSVSIHIIN